MALIKPVFPHLQKSFSIFGCGFFVPWFWMEFSPCFQFFFPLPQHILRDSIGQPESDKICGIFLFPLWKVATAFYDLTVWIHGAELGDRHFQRITRFGGRDARRSHRLAAASPSRGGHDACAPA